MADRGRLITFEGGEGTGKSTQLELLRRHLEQRGFATLGTREPGGTPLAEAIRELLLDRRHVPDGLTEVFLLEAARRDLVQRVVRPALERGAIVLCDRFSDSSLVYQGLVRGVGLEAVAELNRLATGGLEPDLTLLFDVDPGVSLTRVESRNAGGRPVESRFDAEPDAFHRAVRDAYLELARLEPRRVRVIDAAGATDVVGARVLTALPSELR
jgi:dTMP kinase